MVKVVRLGLKLVGLFYSWTFYVRTFFVAPSLQASGTAVNVVARLVFLRTTREGLLWHHNYSRLVKRLQLTRAATIVPPEAF